LRWPVLALVSLAIAGNYYAYDSIAPVAEMLRHQRGLSQQQIGLLNAVFSLPNILVALIGGIIIDRIGAARASLVSAALCATGALLTAIGSPYELMVTGRLIFGIGEETLLIGLLAGLAQWFSAGAAAMAMSLFFSLARVGSYLADISPSWAGALYERGWQPPLWLAAGFTGISLAAAAGYLGMDRFRGSGPCASAGLAPSLRDLTRFDRSFWYILWLNVLFASVFFPFRSTFAIEFLQDAKHLTLAEAGTVNGWVFFSAILATPLFGLLADRIGKRALLLTFGAALMPVTFALLGATNASLWISTAFMGISFSVIPAVIWPATAMLVEPRRLGTAFGIINVLQNLGLAICNVAAGWLNDFAQAGPDHPTGYRPMLGLFFGLSLVALLSTWLLWRRESGPNGHGLEVPVTAE
jgi:MFS family permease